MFSSIKRRSTNYPFYWKLKAKAPIITSPSGKLPCSKTLNFVLIVGLNFDQSKPNAETTCRIGYCRGFEQIGVPFHIISIAEIYRKLDDIEAPVCWISGSDYRMLSRENAKVLKRHKHMVWVTPLFKGDTAYYEKLGLPERPWPEHLCKKVLSTRPEFVFAASTRSAMDFYRGWEKLGARVVALPLGCDVDLYHPHYSDPGNFRSIKMALVGGYWPEKAKQFDRYLKPFEDILTVFGYNKWPYRNYGGMLERRLEPPLYKYAGLCPVINEPRVELMGTDMCERLFKVLGCQGLAVTDCAKVYRDLFTEQELLVPHNPKEYVEIVMDILRNPAGYQRYRQSGFDAVLNGHTYAHRAKQVLEELGIESPETDGIGSMKLFLGASA
jgi:hypothetical protein